MRKHAPDRNYELIDVAPTNRDNNALENISPKIKRYSKKIQRGRNHVKDIENHFLRNNCCNVYGEKNIFGQVYYDFIFILIIRNSYTIHVLSGC